MKKHAIAGGLIAALTVPAVLLAAAPAHADIERSGRCAGAEFELSVDREHRGFEVEADIDDARPGSAWRVTLRHEGKVFYSKIRHADREGDISVDRFRHNTRGKDKFRLKVTPVGGKSCSVKVITR